MSAIEQIVWGDVLFAIDFSMDYLCLYFCLRMQRQEIRVARLCIGAAIGAVFGVVSVALPILFQGILGIVMSIITSFFCCFLALPRIRQKLLRAVAMIPLFFVTEAALGGIMTAVYLWLGKTLGSQTDAANQQRNTFGLFQFLGILAFSIAVFFLFRRILLSKNTQENENQRFLVKYNGYTAVFSCFFDSGNLAKEPISGEAVIFLPKDTLRKFGLTEKTLTSGEVKGSRLIPIQTVTGNDLLWGIFPKEQYLLYGDSAKRISSYIVFIEMGKSDTAVLPQANRLLTFSY